MYRWDEEASRPRLQDFQKTTWKRVTRSRRCPVCGRPDWCGIATDGSVAMCMRVAEGAVCSVDQGHGIGHVHRLGEGTVSRIPSYAPPQKSVGDFQLDFPAILARWRTLMPEGGVEKLARILGVSIFSLDRLGATYCPDRDCWAFPMYDARRNIIGIRLRAMDGSKFALPGSRAGIFLPSALASRGTILLPEGPTDTAAAITMGFEAVGRPSNTGGVSLLCDLLEVMRRREVVVVADADGPGRYGAVRLANRLHGICGPVKRIVTSPHKDLREWLRAGRTGDQLRARIKEAPPHELTQDELDKDRDAHAPENRSGQDDEAAERHAT